MFIDSGCKYNLLTVASYEQLRDDAVDNHILNFPTLVTYSDKKRLEIVGAMRARVKVPGRPKEVVANFYAVKDATLNLMGYSTAKALKTILVGEDALQMLYKDYAANVVMGITNESGNLIGPDEVIEDFPAVPNVKLKFDVDLSVTPKFRNFCIGANKYKEEMKQELRENLLAGIIRKVKFPGSSWVNPAMMVPKKDGKMRFCVDMTAPNKAIRRNYSIKMPTLRQMETAAKGHTWFAKLDLKKAFHHIELDESSKYLTTFRTPFGYFQYNRMPFGLNIAPEFFQGILEGLLVGDADIPGVSVYIDDILIVAKSEPELLEKLAKVRAKLSANNLSINEDKTEIRQNEIEFLGFLISTNKVTVTEDRVKAITSMIPPTSFLTLKSFLGKINFLNSFIPRLAELSIPLWEAAKHEKDFKWTEVENESFIKVKNAIAESRERCHFETGLPTYLITDASDRATAAILFQLRKDGNGNTQLQVVEYASKLLNPIQTRYPQFQRELLGIVLAVKHFAKYLRTTKFVVLTDLETANPIIHQSLCAHKSMLNRHERWMLELSEFEFKIVHIPGKLNVADSLSRLTTISNMNDDFDVVDKPHLFSVPVGDECTVCSLSESSTINDIDIESFMSCSEVLEFTSKDGELMEVIERLRSNRDLPPKWTGKSDTFWVDNIGILRFGPLIVLPKRLHLKAIVIAHATHFGSESTHAILREYVYWPGMFTDVDNFTKNCQTCTLLKNSIPHPPMKPVTPPEHPWQHVAIDLYEAPLLKAKYISVQDYLSKKLVVQPVSSTTASSITSVLDHIFKHRGYVSKIRSDWGSPFQSKEYLEWAHRRGIIIEHSAPYHPEGNGLVERSMRGLNRVLRSCVIRNLTKRDQWRAEVERYVSLYNSRPHRTTGISPNIMCDGRKFNVGLPLSAENVLQERNVEEVRELIQTRQKAMKECRDRVANARRVLTKVGDLVWVKKDKKSNKLDCAFYTKQKYKVVERVGNTVTLVGMLDGKRAQRDLSYCLRCPPPIVDNRRESLWWMIQNAHEPQIHKSKPNDIAQMNVESAGIASKDEIENSEEIEAYDDKLMTEHDWNDPAAHQVLQDVAENEMSAYDELTDSIGDIPLLLFPASAEKAKLSGSLYETNRLIAKQANEDATGRTKRNSATKAAAAIRRGFQANVFLIQEISPDVQEI